MLLLVHPPRLRDAVSPAHVRRQLPTPGFFVGIWGGLMARTLLLRVPRYQDVRRTELELWYDAGFCSAWQDRCLSDGSPR
jgi:hypothetical protein